MENKAKTQSKGQLARSYGCSLSTFIVWLKKIPDFKYDPKTRLLTPKQVETIYLHLGEP